MAIEASNSPLEVKGQAAAISLQNATDFNRRSSANGLSAANARALMSTLQQLVKVPTGGEVTRLIDKDFAKLMD